MKVVDIKTSTFKFVAGWVNSFHLHLPNRNPSESVKSIFICILSILFLFFGFFANSWHLVSQKWFVNHQQDAESLIVGRMVKSHQDGIFSAGGLPGWGSPYTTPVEFDDKPFSFQFKAYENGSTIGPYTEYSSQIGGQGILFSLLDKIIPISPRSKLRLFHAFTSLLSAVALTMIILWFSTEFGLFIGLFVLASVIFSQYLVVFGRNLWWSMWAFYLPMIVVMYYFKHNRATDDSKPIPLGVIVFIPVFMKCIFNGYEFITTTLVMMMVPFVYYTIVNKYSFRKFIGISLKAVFSSCLAIFLSFIILCVQIRSVKGSFMAGVNHVVYTLKKRTHANPDFLSPEDKKTKLLPSLESSSTTVVFKYLQGSYIDFNKTYLAETRLSRFLFRVRYLKLIYLFMLMTVILYFIRKRLVSEREKKCSLALIFATWFSILAPLSWFIFFKAHSYIHTNMNEIVWQMPFTLFGFAVFGLTVKILYSEIFPITKNYHEGDIPR